jgi:hypothetical protein
MVVILFLLKIPNVDTTRISAKAKLAQLDFYGTGLIVPGIVCLLLALQWGGLTYSVSRNLAAMAQGRILSYYCSGMTAAS